MASAALLLLLAQAAAVDPLALEGRAVRAVRVERPPEEAARLRGYVELRVGEPLRAEDVRHAVELIHATGEYQDVTVEAVPAGDGVEVVLRPVPAPLMGELVVQGGILTAREVRRLTRLRAREPLWPNRLQAAAEEVRRALVERGHPQARVLARAEAVGEGTRAVVIMVPGPLLRVRTARIEGAPVSLQAVLAREIAPRPGQPFSQPRAEKAAEGMRRQLARRGRWAARVRAEPTAGPEGVELVFRASTAGPTRVVFQGSSLPAGVEQDVVKLLREGGLQPDALEQASERIEESLGRLGHRQPSVSRQHRSVEGEERVIYTVQAGPRATVDSVRVATDEAPGLEGLLATRAGEPLVDGRLEEDAAALKRALEERGYAQARVEVEVPEGGGALPVVFRVREGPRIEVGSVLIDSPIPAPGGPPRELRLRAGQAYRVRDLALDHGTVVGAYRDAGYPQAEVIPEVRIEDDPSAAGGPRLAQVRLRVVPGPRILVDHVVIAGLHHTREAVVRRELLLKEGEPLGLQKVLESQRRLGSLGIFQRVSISEMDPESPERRSLLVAAEEAPLTTVAYGIGYAERDRIRGSVEVTRRNLFGMDRSLSTFARVSFRGSRLLTTFREPYLLGQRQELFLTAFREEEDRDLFDFIRWGGILHTARTLKPGWNLILRYTFQQTHSFNIVDPDEVAREFTTSTLSGPSASVVLDTRDDPLDPHRGAFVSADLQLSHELLGGDSFAKSFLQATTYERVRGRAVLALSGRVGLARTFGEAPSLLLPRPDRFYAGGDYSLRGFRLESVRPAGGNALLLGGAELRLDAGRYLSTALFAEAGNVYPLVSRVDVADLRYTAGVGLRYRSALGPLRVDWGFKLDRRPGESPSQVHLTIGHAF